MILQRWRNQPVKFIEQHLYDPETRKPFVLFDAERTFLKFAFALGPDGRLKYPDQLFSAPKKSGKTGFGALHLLTTILLFGSRHAEGYSVANDLEQASSRVFEMCRRIVEVSPCSARKRNHQRLHHLPCDRGDHSGIGLGFCLGGWRASGHFGF